MAAHACFRISLVYALSNTRLYFPAIYLSVPCSRDTYSYCRKAGLMLLSATARQGAEQPDPCCPGSTSPDQRPRTRPLLGEGSGAATCPPRRDAQHQRPEARTSPGGSGTSTCLPDPLSARASTPPRRGPELPRAPLPLAWA